MKNVLHFSETEKENAVSREREREREGECKHRFFYYLSHYRM